MLSKGLFWRLYSSQDPTVYSIIFGTIHLPIEEYSIVSKAYNCIDEYDCVYTETSLDNNMESYILPFITLPDSTEWTKHCSARQLGKLKRMIHKCYGIDIDLVMHLRPMIIMGMVYGSLQATGKQKLDHAIWTYGQTHGKELGGIESIQRQVSIMKSIPLNYDFNMLKGWVRNIPAMNKKFHRLLEYYYKEDILSLYKGSVSTMGSLKDLLIYDRNRYMADRIQELHEQQVSFFCFGAGHLAGSRGVLSLLKRKNYKLERI